MRFLICLVLKIIVLNDQSKGKAFFRINKDKAYFFPLQHLSDKLCCCIIDSYNRQHTT